MPVIHRTHVRISRIRPPLPRRVRHHHFRRRANVRVALAQCDGVSITLRHLPPVKSRYPRRLRQHRVWLSKYVVEFEIIRDTWDPGYGVLSPRPLNFSASGAFYLKDLFLRGDGLTQKMRHASPSQK